MTVFGYKNLLERCLGLSAQLLPTSSISLLPVLQPFSLFHKLPFSLPCGNQMEVDGHFHPKFGSDVKTYDTKFWEVVHGSLMGGRDGNTVLSVATHWNCLLRSTTKHKCWEVLHLLTREDHQLCGQPPSFRTCRRMPFSKEGTTYPFRTHNRNMKGRREGAEVAF